MGPLGPEATELSDLSDALKLTEVLRRGGFRFVTLVSENPNSVGKPGVDVTGPDYDWTKRRTTLLRKDVKILP